ncbi:hypothetical protein [Spongiactinospora sp. TRM90649]|uniref:hypothetical protein n=1 Tax=Spongiactinospora sp. TRM90649 TaxID=3031114 RepID=UPI0023F818BB|nr:hypothetical protein [Spongiactinospora sp. TRM90649]MDF5758767.1 hypothetical protein [Spongiactinospora sp. TRM90649]
MTRCAKFLALHGVTEDDVAPPEQRTAPTYTSDRSYNADDARRPLHSSNPIPAKKERR